MGYCPSLKKLFFSFVLCVLFGLLVRNICTISKPSYQRKGKAKVRRPDGLAACLDPDVRPKKPTADGTVEMTDEPRLLTLFTTLKDVNHKLQIHRNTLRNWRQFREKVSVVLYYEDDDHEWRYRAREMGWFTRKVPAYHRGLPIVRHMFMETIRYYESSYYAYANADMLFDEGLIKTLEYLKFFPNRLDKMLMVGTRTNINASLILNVYKPTQIKETSDRWGQPFVTDAQDFFIVGKDSYAWSEIPDFVVGRVGYDNWLVAYAIDNGLSVIDVSKTITAVHQIAHEEEHRRSRYDKKPDHEINLEVGGLEDDYDIRGQTDCAPYATYYLEKGTMCLARRIVGPHCQDDGDSRGWWWYLRVCAIRLTNLFVPDLLDKWRYVTLKDSL